MSRILHRLPGGLFGSSPVVMAGSLAEARREFFEGSDGGCLFDPYDVTTLFRDVAGTQAIGIDDDGAPVALMRDKSGFGWHAVQADAAKQLNYRTDGTRRWLETRSTTSGSVQYMDVVTPIKSKPRGIVFAATVSSVRTQQTLFQTYGTDSTNVWMAGSLEISSGGKLASLINTVLAPTTGYAPVDPDPFPYDVPAVFGSRFDKAAASYAEVRVGGVVKASATGVSNTYAGTAEGMRLFVYRDTTVRNFRGKFYGCAFSQVFPTVEATKLMEAYFSMRSGATLASEMDLGFAYALLDEGGQPILDHDGQYILDEGAP